MSSIAGVIAKELSAGERQVRAAVDLLDEGATVPFIARYRKEATGGLDDAQLRTLEDRLHYLRELQERRETVLRSIEEQGKLTPELKQAVLEADSKVRLEDLYRPYKPKRRTKAEAARKQGLEPLARTLLANPRLVPRQEAKRYVDAERGVPDADAALEGAREILMEEFSQAADLLGELREWAWRTAELHSRNIRGKESEGAKFADYFEYSEPIQRIPSHRALALFRGRKEGILKLSLQVPENPNRARGKKGSHSRRPEGRPALTLPEIQIASHFSLACKGRPADTWLLETVTQAWKKKIFPHLKSELEGRLREAAEEEAIRVFGGNLRDLLMAAPAGPRAVMGLDPGFRTGVKVAVVDATGKLLATDTVYPHPPQEQQVQALKTLAALCRRHGVSLIAIGNGTASRETDRLAARLIKDSPELRLEKLVVSEAGASVYSASETASKEFPDLDVSLRGAVSIARRLQDPLAELVKIDPKSIGVGQYQHDVTQSQLARKLDGVVEDCVNAVGVDVNTASAPLLAHVSGLNAGVAEKIVEFRDRQGPFRDRTQFMQVPRMGEKTFELSAGFLRIPDGDNPLDASAVHPEAYPVVKRIIRATGREVRELIGNTRLLGGLKPNDFTDQRFGEPTVRDILSELEKPGRDPRPEFRTAQFQEGVETLEDLAPGMQLEGVVSNVTNFGAFVDVGVHQDGLVHISQLADRFVKDPRNIVKAGDIVKVRVLQVDPDRRRISLSIRRS
ncbi:MAG TPA: Tex family protein [Acidobacteriota bacterium]|nr:Tex family protein [Acidobacteriota bacterium]